MSDYSQDYGLSDYDQDYGLYDYGYNTGDQYQTQFGEEDTYGGEREKVPYGGERKDWDEFSITGSDMGYAGRLSVLDIMALYLLPGHEQVAPPRPHNPPRPDSREEGSYYEPDPGNYSDLVTGATLELLRDQRQEGTDLREQRQDGADPTEQRQEGADPREQRQDTREQRQDPREKSSLPETFPHSVPKDVQFYEPSMVRIFV